MAKRLIEQEKQPIILVDWSDLTQDGKQQLLRASLPLGGRALTLYEEVHSLKVYANHHTHSQFLKNLKNILPKGTKPIIVTDAGFCVPWFRAVEKCGWNWVGRVLKRVMIKSKGKKWSHSKLLIALATGRAKAHGLITLTRSNPLDCFLYTFKKQKKNRVKKNVYGEPVRCSNSLKNARREQQPWLLASSLEKPAKNIIRLYQTRMQIEQGFRDIKNHRYGLSLSDSLTQDPKRLANLLLIGALAIMTAWLVGKVAEKKNLHRQFQSNTIRSRTVLSIFFLGCLILQQNQFSFTKQQLDRKSTRLNSSHTDIARMPSSA